MRIRLTAPSRLHFGLLAHGPEAPRQFGGVGLMIEQPGLEISAEPSTDWRAQGPLADRALQVARRVVGRLGEPNPNAVRQSLRLRIHRAPPEHVGLGTGTQLSLAIARVLAEHWGRPDVSVPTLAEWTDRGRRSGIGLHGFAHGGLIVDGGRGPTGGVPPLLARLEWPEPWSVLVVIPTVPPGLHGPDEAQAFQALPPIPDAVTDRLARLVLLGLLPAVLEDDLPTFGDALTELQRRVGECFSPAQGGLYASRELEAVADAMRSAGLVGVGQSSWGPTLYGFSRSEPDHRAQILQSIANRFRLDATTAFWTRPCSRGAILQRTDD